jgi:hypothetical protein
MWTQYDTFWVLSFAKPKTFSMVGQRRHKPLTIMLVYGFFLFEGWLCAKDIQIMNYWRYAGGQIIIFCLLFTGPDISYVAVGRGGLSTAQETVFETC